MEEYRIDLGIGLNDGDFADIKKKINSLEDNPIKIKIDAETKELTNTIKDALNSLSKGSKNALTFDTSKIEASLNDVSSTIKEIKSAIGSLDSGSGMKSLVGSINSISSALDKASAKFDELVGDLKSLSGKDFNLNFGINLGSSNSVARQGIYGSHVRSETLPELKKQAKALQDYFKEYYKVQDELSAIMKLAPNRGGDIVDLYSPMSGYKSKTEKESLSNQMGAYREYINIIKEAASLRGIDISHITSGFSKSADQLIQDAQDIQTGAKEMDESFDKLKQIFGGGNNLNIEGLSASLEPIIKDLTAIRETIEGLSSGVSIEGLTQSFDRLSEVIEKLISNATLVKNALGDGLNANISNNGTEKAIQDQKELAQTFRETANEAKKLDGISIDISEGNVDDLRNALKNLKVDDSSIENATNELNEMNIVAKSVSGTLREGNLIKWEIKGIQTTTDGLERAVTITKTLGEEGWSSSAKYSQALDKVAIAAEKVKTKLSGSNTGTSKFDDEILQVETSYAKLANKTKDLDAVLKGLRNSFKEVKAAADAGDDEALLAANERYKKSLRDVISLIKQREVAERSANNDDALETAKQNALLRLKNLFGENSEAARKFASEIDRIQKEINECGNLSGIPNLNRQITNLGLQVKEAGYQTQTFSQRLKKQWQQYSSYLSVASLVSYGTQALRSMFEQVKLIDSAMTELKKVTNETDEAYSNFLKNAATRSREIGTTIDGLVSSTADFARLGYGFEDAQGLAEVANIYAVVGDEINGVEGATESLISTMAAFKDEMNGMNNTDFAMSIIDKFNEIGNNFAISSGGIGEALERSASSLMAANNTIDESIALITAAM